MDSKDYYILRTKGGEEFKAVKFLDERYVSARCPAAYQLRRSRRAKKFVTVRVPYIPNYIFVRRAALHNLQAYIKQSSFIYGFVQTNGRLCVVPEQQILDLEKLASGSEALEVWLDGPVKKGSVVEVSEGIFDTRHGQFVRMVNSAEAVVDLLINDRSVRTVLPAKTLRIKS